MSIICLICKDKLLNNAPGSSSFGSLNSLVENQVIATGCGHLYHFECIQSWLRTQKKKLQNQGITGNFPDHCPTCQAEVLDDQIRRIFLLEDHRDALEKAKFLEKMENLEIYCHQLEIHIQQLRRENDLLVNKALAPPSSQREEFSTIVKNDRVVWLKKDSPPLSGIVLSIFKKEGELWVKLKLDKKIRMNQRSGILGSFRFDKKQDWTVPFEEIMLEKDFKRNNIIHENTSLSEPSTPTLRLPPQRMPSFRSSTLSLPEDYMSRYVSGLDGLKPRPTSISSYDQLYSSGSNMELAGNSPLIERPQVGGKAANNNIGDSMTSVATLDTPTTPPIIQIEDREGDQREYVLLGPTSAKPAQQLNGKFNGEIRIIQDAINRKHVTFADDVEMEKAPISPEYKGNHFRDHDYNNVLEIGGLQSDREHDIISPPTPDRSSLALMGHLKVSVVDEVEEEETAEASPVQLSGSSSVPSIHLIQPSTSSTPSSTPTLQPDLQSDIFLDAFDLPTKPQPDGQGNAPSFNSTCFDSTFMVLFYGCGVFDKVLLRRDSPRDDIQQSVQVILRDEFVQPFRQTQKYTVGYSSRLHGAISHLCSSFLDLEELMTILFEYVFKMPPFISYSYDMCDYIHQFFIDFTDKARHPTVQQLFERSLSLQDNLKLRGNPSPALMLQMPNSEDGIIHYDTVVPSLTLNIEQMLEKDVLKPASQPCYCNKVATLECATCAKIHGKSPVLFCEDCSVLLEAIHDQMYHKLELVPITALDIPSTTLELGAVICLKGDKYTTFLRNTQEDEDVKGSKWVYVEEFRDGAAQTQNLPELDSWIESISRPDVVDKKDLDSLQLKLLTECRMFLYLPVQNSYA